MKKEKVKKFRMVSLYPCNISEIEQLQDETIASLDDKSIFQTSTREEILESMLIDACYGLYDDEKLIALSIIVFNRKSDRNLCVDWERQKKELTYINYVTFDTI